MKTKLHLTPRTTCLTLLLALLSTLNFQTSTLFAQGTAFTYQGRLNAGVNPASGTYDLRFTIYDSTNNPGVVIAGPITNFAAGVSNGFFTVALDFGPGPFTNGAPRWLEIGVRTNGGGAFAALAPRQQLTPTPYAIYAEGASAAGLNGTIPSLNLGGTYGNAVNFNNGANDFDGTFTGQFFGSIFTGGLFTGTFLGSGSGLGDVWHTAGNLGTAPPANFLGTIDNQPLEVRVNNQRVLRLEPANDINVGSVPNLIGGHSANSVTTNIGGSVIGGGGGSGLANTIASTEDVIAGGYLNHIEGGNAHASTIGGGFDNTIQSAASRATIAGGHANRIGTNSFGATVGGGEGNAIGTNAVQAVIAGGGGNGILGNAFWSTVSGGYGNVASGVYSTVAGGAGNANSGFGATIAGGQLNTNSVNGNYGAIGGGIYNTVSGFFYATVPGGFSNLAAGSYSFAAGRQARALHDGTFVWADSTAADFSSSANDQFLVRASGGIFLNTGPGGVNLDQFGLNIGDLNYGLKFGPGSGEGIASKRTPGGNQFGLDFYTEFTNRMAITQNGNVGIGTNNPSALLHLVASNPTNIALKISNGGISVAGAGVGTSTPAFIQVATVANIFPSYGTLINNPLCNGDPNAILIVTPNWVAGGGVYNNHVVGVSYIPPQWVIFNEDFAAMPTNAAFNVLVIKP